MHRGDIELHVEATGSVQSNLDVDIKSKASGEIIKLPYDVGHRVPAYEPGRNEDAALLVALDPVDEQRRVQISQSDRDVAKARLDQAQQNLKIAQSDLASQRLQVAANIQSAQARRPTWPA